ncbi:unnamed protein product [Calicophoron daubneyi]|uniref:Uncharacterized protein n=1 Tax=Calicophoron daubneyi TaxID=300641 RepID=A0AAV2TJC1_CALDB
MLRLLLSFVLLVGLCPGVFGHRPRETSNRELSTLVTKTNESANNSTRPAFSQAVGLGFVATTVTNLAAAGGLAFFPLRKYKIYPVIVSFMVATAVGALFTNAVMMLFPEALGLDELVDDVAKTWYVPFSVACCGGCFLFFVLEFLFTRIKIKLERRSLGKAQRSGSSSPETGRFPANNEAPARSETETPSAGTLTSGVNDNRHGNMNSASLSLSTEQVSLAVAAQDESQGIYSKLKPRFTFTTPHLCSKLGGLEPVVWMVLIGDGVHNFMDGLSIGASFTKCITTGISISLGVLCEELPHELGDLAVLLHSGMSIWLAVVFNLASACTAYLGFALGVCIGELPSGSRYVFAVTTGFFLYISLADMLREVHRTQEAMEGNDKHMMILFLVHCGGLLFGFSCILTIALISDLISI